MTGPRRAALAWVGLISACHGTVDLPAPAPSAPHRSFLLILAPPGQLPRVFAGSAEQDDPLPSFTFESSAPLSLFALYFDCALHALGFSPGWQEVSRESGLRLPSRSREALGAEIDEGSSPTWRPLSDIPADLRTLRFPRALRENNCAEFSARLVPLPGSVDESGSMAVRLAPLEALVATSTGHFYRLTPERAEPLTAISTTTPHLGGYLDREGTVWLFGAEGRVARGDPSTGFELTGTTSTAGGRYSMHVDGSRGDAPIEIFAVGDRGTFDRYADGRWEALFADDDDGPEDWPGVVWLGPREALAIGLRGSRVLHYRDGRIEEEPLVPSGMRAMATSIASIPGLGVVVGSYGGRFFVRGEEGWAPLVRPGERDLVRALHPFHHGFLAGLPNGVLVELDAEHGFCAPRQVVPNGTVQMLRMGEEIMALTISEVHVQQGQLAAAAFIRPILPDQGCASDDW